MLKIGVLVSGGGTNLQSIIDSIENGYIDNAEIVTVVSNRKNAYALERAKKHNIEAVCISPRNFNDRKDFNIYLRDYFIDKGIDLIVMAGYLVVVGEELVNAFPNKIMNIHPSLIPAFCGDGYYGLNVHKAVIARGVKLSGATVHFVDNGTDTGPIIIQKQVAVLDNDTAEELQQRIMLEAEHVIYPTAIKLFCEDKINIVDNKVYIED